MYNLHSHTFLSDGALLPSEVAVRYQSLGYKGIAITDHADYSNIDMAIKAVMSFTQHWPKQGKIKVFPGIELTHLPPEQFKPLAKYARSKGIKIIVAHGETPVEPVTPGTNRAALEADIDILAHPGKISEEDALLAKKRWVFLEITSRHGHDTMNAHVANMVTRFDVPFILNNDSHQPEDIITPQKLGEVGIKAGLSLVQIEQFYQKLELFLCQKG